jgi:hypothetical protein
MGSCDGDKSQGGPSVTNDCDDHSDSIVDHEAEEEEGWIATDVGYTPLSDVSNPDSSSFLVSMGPTSENSDGEDSISRSTFYANANAIGNTVADELGSSQEQIDENCQSIAENALLALDEEYNRTLKEETRDGFENLPSQTLPRAENEDLKLIAAAFDNAKTDTNPNFNVESQPALFKADWESALTSSTHLSSVNTNADASRIRKVVQEISLKIEGRFQQNFAAWSQKQNHDVIPQAPLKAFQRSTGKAQQATASLSRSATLAEAILRLKQQNFLRNTNSPFVVDIVGVDHTECDSIERIQSTFRPIVRWLGAWERFDEDEIELRLIGRDLSPRTSSQPVDLSTKVVKARATCHSGVYHEWLLTSKSAPSMIAAFNG